MFSDLFCQDHRIWNVSSRNPAIKSLFFDIFSKIFLCSILQYLKAHAHWKCLGHDVSTLRRESFEDLLVSLFVEQATSFQSWEVLGGISEISVKVSPTHTDFVSAVSQFMFWLLGCFWPALWLILGILKYLHPD